MTKLTMNIILPDPIQVFPSNLRDTLFKAKQHAPSISKQLHGCTNPVSFMKKNIRLPALLVCMLPGIINVSKAQSAANIDWSCFSASASLVSGTNDVIYVFTSANCAQANGFSAEIAGTGALDIRSTISPQPFLRLQKTGTTPTLSYARLYSTLGTTFKLTGIAVAPTSVGATAGGSQSITVHAYKANSEIGSVTTAVLSSTIPVAVTLTSSFNNIDEIRVTSSSATAAGIGIDNVVTTTASTLPVTWASFTVIKQNQSAIVSWSTATEQNTKDFTVQHSIDGISWNTAAIITAAGNSSTLRNYSYVHNNTEKGYNYYRIMQTDLDGKISYSEVRMINLPGENAAFTIAGNRISNGVLQVQVHQTTVISLHEVSGRLLWVKQFTPGLQSIDVSRYNKGIYLLTTKETAQKIVIQ